MSRQSTSQYLYTPTLQTNQDYPSGDDGPVSSSSTMTSQYSPLKASLQTSLTSPIKTSLTSPIKTNLTSTSSFTPIVQQPKLPIYPTGEIAKEPVTSGPYIPIQAPIYGIPGLTAGSGSVSTAQPATSGPYTPIQAPIYGIPGLTAGSGSASTVQPEIQQPLEIVPQRPEFELVDGGGGASGSVDDNGGEPQILVTPYTEAAQDKNYLPWIIAGVAGLVAIGAVVYVARSK
jgi:hypothetical protein